MEAGKPRRRSPPISKPAWGKASETLLLIRVQQAREASYRTEGFRSVTAPPAPCLPDTPAITMSLRRSCAVLESWTSGNPLYVISQAFIGGGSTGADRLQRSAARTYNGINTGSYYPGFDDASFSATLRAMKKDGVVSSSNFITNADIPVPTLFAGYAADDASIPYWISVNDAVPVSGEQGLFRQNIHSDAWQTVYANQNAKNWDPGTPYGISRFRCRKTAA